MLNTLRHPARKKGESITLTRVKYAGYWQTKENDAELTTFDGMTKITYDGKTKLFSAEVSFPPHDRLRLTQLSDSKWEMQNAKEGPTPIDCKIQR